MLLPSPMRTDHDAVRDQALASGVIALVLSFLSAQQRLQAGRICRRWLTALQQPSLWSSSGWHCPDAEGWQKIHLPLLVQQRLGTLRCGSDWLLFSHLLAKLRRLPQLRRLELTNGAREAVADVSVVTLVLQLVLYTCCLRGIRSLETPPDLHTACACADQKPKMRNLQM